GSEASSADVRSELELLRRGPECTGPAVSARGTTSGNENTLLCFEELGKRCVKLEWQIDPHNSVFVNARPGQEGSERFRTLRSRLDKIRSEERRVGKECRSGGGGEK